MSIIFFIFGACLGSFFNVCIYRLPLDKSIVKPPSSCPKCKKRIKWYDNIPILSYIFLRAKCRHCGQKISIIYPVVELLTAIIFLVSYLKFGLSIKLFAYAVLFSLFIIIGFIDAQTKLIPDVLSISGLVVGLLLSHFTIGLKSSILGAVVGTAAIAFFAVFGRLAFKKEAMGMGDLKLLAMMGSFSGWVISLYTIFYGSILGLLTALFAIPFSRKKSSEPFLDMAIPFGPFLVIANFLLIMFGNFKFLP